MNPLPPLALAALCIAGSLSPATAATEAAAAAVDSRHGGAIAETATEPTIGAASAIPPIATPAASGYRFGVEINPVMLAQSFSRQARGDHGNSGYDAYLTGTLSAALPGQRLELAIPFAVVDYDAANREERYLFDDLEGDYSLRRVDLQLRQYAKSGRKGLYAGALLRFSRISGISEESYAVDYLGTGDPVELGPRDATFSRFGAGVVFDLRGDVQLRQSGGRLFWGANVHLGRWIGGSPTPLASELFGPMEDTESIFANVEFAKVGLRF